jgi:hypothetical protein
VAICLLIRVEIDNDIYTFIVSDLTLFVNMLRVCGVGVMIICVYDPKREEN